MDWSIIKELKTDEGVWVIIFCALVSPIGLGYFISGFFFGFESFNIQHIVIGAFLASPVLFSAYLQSSIETQIKDFEYAIKKKRMIDYEEESKDVITSAFLLQAMFSWILIFISLVLWLLFERNPLIKSDSSTIILLVFSFFYFISIFSPFFYIVSKNNKFMKLKEGYKQLIEEQE